MDGYHSFVTSCFPKVKLHFAYFWLHFQARKRRFAKKNNRAMRLDEIQRVQTEISRVSYEEKFRWATNLLKKLEKDITIGNRSDFVKALHGDTTDCVISNPDQRGKMRRIDCLRQADKVWRLDLVVMVLFHGAPLESTDGERIHKTVRCIHPGVCVNPSHIGVVVKELDLFISRNVYLKECSGNPEMLISGIFVEDGLQQQPVTGNQQMHSARFDEKFRVHPYATDARKSRQRKDNETSSLFSDTDSGIFESFHTPTKIKDVTRHYGPYEQSIQNISLADKQVENITWYQQNCFNESADLSYWSSYMQQLETPSVKSAYEYQNKTTACNHPTFDRQLQVTMETYAEEPDYACFSEDSICANERSGYASLDSLFAFATKMASDSGQTIHQTQNVQF